MQMEPEDGDGGVTPAAGSAGGHQCLEWCPICRGAEVVRSTTPDELRDQFESIQRDAVSLLKALLDAYQAKQAETGDAAGGKSDRGVENIPIS